MPTRLADPVRAIDIGALTRFIYELNIARRQMAAYPKGHPVIAAAAGKAVEIFGTLLESCEEVTLGIARDTLVLGDACLERKNPVFRDLARHLFTLGVASITFSRGLTRGELSTFNELLAHSREEVREAGGMARLLEDLGIRNIRIEEIDYQAFRATEESRVAPRGQDPAAPPAVALWEGFISGLLQARLDPDGAPLAGFEELESGEVAALLNDDYDPNPADYGASIVAFLRRLEDGRCDGETRDRALEKLAALVSRLNPELRRQFLGSTFGAGAPSAAAFLECLPTDMVVDTLADISARRLTVPQPVFALLEKLARHGGEGGGRVTGGSYAAGEDLAGRLDLIFREVEADKFVPADYQSLLGTALAGGPPLNDNSRELEALKETLGSHRVETRVSAVILELINGEPTDSQTQALKRNLLELCDYFIEMGDFVSLLQMHNRLSGVDRAEAATPVGRELLAAFARPAFLEETLNALQLWGKGKFREIEELITAVGTPFIEPLLDRLAAATTIPLRRYYMERLQGFGPLALPAILARLGDGRWFFVRNLIMILRNLEDPTVAADLEPLLDHPHPKVRQEVLATLLHFRAPVADRVLLERLADGDPAEQLRAVLLAPRAPAAFQALLALLGKNALTNSDYGIKRGVVQALAETGNPTALPELLRLLRSTNFLHPILHGRLKLEIVRSMDRYPAASAGPILSEVARSASGELARTAAQAIKNLQGRGV